jgi:hypothetical protein
MMGKGMFAYHSIRYVMESLLVEGGILNQMTESGSQLFCGFFIVGKDEWMVFCYIKVIFSELK